MIQVRGLSVRYGQIEALRNIDLDVAAGECLLVAGPSGCGKSTLARSLGGLIPHAIQATLTGSVRVAGLEISQHSLPEIAQRVGSVFQNPSSQLFHLTVADEVAFGPRNLSLPGEEIAGRVEWALEAVGLGDLRRCNPATLSGGQKQRVAVAAALAMRPQVLVLDEPCASLDIRGTEQVITTLQWLRERLEMTIVIIEHRLAAAARLASRVVILDEGRLSACGAPQEIFGQTELLRRLGLRRLASEPQLPWEELLAPNGRIPGGSLPLLELRNVSAGYGGKPVVHGANLALYPGDLVALVGENGAGKSTLALAASGLIKPSQGQVLFSGKRRFRPGRDIALLFQNPADQLLTDSVDEEVSFGPNNYRCFDPLVHQSALNSAGLSGLGQRRPVELSAGQQQRTALAACLALQPALLILDEPTLGQDWGHLERLMDALVRLNQAGTAILLITHDYKLVHHYARRVVLMQAGRILMEGHLTPRAEAGDA